jgi:hypothetical protein
MSAEPEEELKGKPGRPHSPNPLVSLAVRIPSSYKLLIDAMAESKGITTTALVMPWITRGYDAERTKAEKVKYDP